MKCNETLQPLGLGVRVVGVQCDRFARVVAEAQSEPVRFDSDADAAQRQTRLVRHILRKRQRQRK